MDRPRALTLGVPLDADHESVVRRVRRRLGVPVGATTPCSHISLLVLPGGSTGAAIEAALGAVAGRTRAFSVRARGLGVFHDGDGGLVLYVPVVRTPELAQLHLDLYETVVATGARIDGHYAPSSWFPHVTLWDRSLTPEAVGAAVTTMAGRPALAWTLPVTHLAALRTGGTLAAVPLVAGW